MSKSFGGTAAIKNIDLDIDDGEMVVLLGPSGCGKTTTMRCIAGLETPDDGLIRVGGVTVFDGGKGIEVPANRRNIGMVFQSYAIWPHMTVYQNVAFPLEMQRLNSAEIKNRVMETLEQVSLTDYAGRGASALSGGQMQRVALARSLVMRPAVLLFDEPLSNLDARLRDRLRIQLRELQTRLRITGIYVTHDQQEALALADRIVVMSRGEIKQIGDPVSIYNHPRSSEIAEFIGYSNIFPASVEPSGTVVLTTPGTTLRSDTIPQGIGNEVFVCVRPDGVEIARLDGADGSPAGVNTIEGEVSLASFMGSHMLFRVVCRHGDTWEVLSKDIVDDIRLGDRVRLAIPPSQIRVLPAR